MSKFSTYLKYLIEESGESISFIARSIGAERTSIHRALKDERVLPYKVVHALAKHLQLSLEERQEFFQLYDMLIQGEDVWHNCAAVSELLTQLSTIQFEVHDKTEDHSTLVSASQLTDYKLVEGEYSVQNIIYALLSQEASKNTDVRFQVFLPPATDLTTTFMHLWRSGNHFIVDQIFCFSSIVGQDCTQSVQILQQIIPLCLSARDAYRPYYFYENPGPLSVNPLNYYIVTPHYLILLSEEQSTALILCSESLIDFYSKHFCNLLEYCESLITCSTTLTDILKISTDMIDRKSALYLMSQPCFGRYYTPQFITKYFQGGNNSTTKMYKAVEEHFSIVRDIENFKRQTPLLPDSTSFLIPSNRRSSVWRSGKGQIQNPHHQTVQPGVCPGAEWEESGLCGVP